MHSRTSAATCKAAIFRRPAFDGAVAAQLDKRERGNPNVQIGY